MVEVVSIKEDLVSAAAIVPLLVDSLFEALDFVVKILIFLVKDAVVAVAVVVVLDNTGISLA